MDFMGKWFQMTVFQIIVRLHVYNRLRRKLIKPLFARMTTAVVTAVTIEKIQGNERMFWFLLGVLLNTSVFQWGDFGHSY